MISRIKSRKNKGFHSGRVSFFRYQFVRTCYLLCDIFVFIPVFILAILSRLARRSVDVGIGPLPSINSKYHKIAMQKAGYTCETFVYHTWYLTSDFDINVGNYCPRVFGPYASYLIVLFRYKCIYTYFNGGPLGFTTLLARLEPLLFQIAGIKTVVMAFGADVQVATRIPNLLMRDAIARDYPGFRHARRRTADLVDAWTRGADHVIGGCDWVDCLYHWDSLMLSHFAIDTDQIRPGPPTEPAPDGVLRVVHAPNHRNLKGTHHLIDAVDALRAEGRLIALDIIEEVPNAELLERLKAYDVVVDQLVIGWYAMFALEGMALGKPVVCHIRDDLAALYRHARIIGPEDPPLIDASTRTIEEVLRRLCEMNRTELAAIGAKSRAFVENHHSVAAISVAFAEINARIGLTSSASDPHRTSATFQETS